MKLSKIVEHLNLQVLSGYDNLDVEIKRGYASDLLSDVLANSSFGDLWITMQIHPNIVAAAFARDLAGVILVNSRKPEPETLEKAVKEAIPIMVTDMPAFELIGKLYALGINGAKDA